MLFKKIFTPLLFLTVVYNFALAQTEPPTQKVIAEIISHVSIYNATTTKQNNHTFTFDFDLINHAGVDPDVHYGVSLLQKVKGTSNVVDQKAYS